MACRLFWLGAPLPTCRGWVSVRAPIPTTQERLLAPSVAAPPATGAAERHSDNCERVSHKCWGRGRRASVLLPELLQKCQKRRRISLFGRRVGHFLALRVCVWLEKGLTEAEKEFSGVGVCVGERVCVTAISRQTRGPCFPLPFLQRIQPSSAHFPRLSRRHPLPSEGVRLQSELQLPPWHTGGVICTEHCGPPQITAHRIPRGSKSERGQSRCVGKTFQNKSTLHVNLQFAVKWPDVWESRCLSSAFALAARCYVWFCVTSLQLKPPDRSWGQKSVIHAVVCWCAPSPPPKCVLTGWFFEGGAGLWVEPQVLTFVSPPAWHVLNIRDFL